jgi:ubiquitin-protein ligase
MPKLPRALLERRLKNEEEELRSKGYSFRSRSVWAEANIPTVLGQETVPVAYAFDVRLKAKGLVRPNPNDDPSVLEEHEAQLSILESYPYVTDKSRLGAPFRLLWTSPIFHPNIAQGTSAGGPGIVCWDLLKGLIWTNLDTLFGIVKGLELLIEHPNTKSPLRFEQCIDAAKWFDAHPDYLRK